MSRREVAPAGSATAPQLVGADGYRQASVESATVEGRELGREGGNIMSGSLTIEEFSELLTSEGEDSPLLVALRELTKVEEEEVVGAISNAKWGW